MVRSATYILIVLCVLAALWGLMDKSAPPAPADTLDGTPLRLLSELTDEEIGGLELPGDINEIPQKELVNEFSASPSDAEALEVVAVQSPSLGKEAIQSGCLLVGELKDLGEAQKLVRQIAAEGADTILVTRIVEEFGPYMVYIPPKSDVDEAIAAVESLRANRIESIVIRDGTYKNGVSLGVFRSEANSAAFLSRIQGLGYDARRRRQTREEELHSILVSGLLEANIEERFWVEVRSDYEDLSVTEKNCDEVASAGNFQ